MRHGEDDAQVEAEAEAETAEGDAGAGGDWDSAAAACETADDCAAAGAVCVFSDDQLRSVCRCGDGYRGDGRRCAPADACDGPEDCSVDAQCRFDAGEQRYVCRCFDGFHGDGRTCRLDPAPDADDVDVDVETPANSSSSSPGQVRPVSMMRHAHKKNQQKSMKKKHFSRMVTSRT